MKTLVIMFLMICFSVGQVAATTNDEAIAAYQQGKAAMERSAPQDAIPFFKTALDVCTALYIDPCRTINLDELGNAYAMLERYDETLKAFQQSLSIKKSSGAPPDRIIRALNDIGQVLYALKKYDDAQASFKEGLDISRSLDIKGATALLLEGSGMAHFASNNLSQARESFEESLRLQRELAFPGEETVRNLNNLGAVFMSSRQYSQAQPYLEEALTTFRKMNMPEATATGLNNLGYALAQLGQHERAMGYYEESLAIRKKHNSALDTAIVLNNMGLLLVSMGKHDDGLARHEEALRLRRQSGDRQAIAESLSNIGFAHYYSGSYDNAMKYFDQALQIHEGLGDKRILATSLNNMASAYERLGRYEKALQCHERSLQLRRQLNIPADTAMTLNNIGQMNLDLGLYDKAMSYFYESLNIKIKHGLPAESIAISLNNIGAVYDSTKQPDRALDVYQQALSINRELKQTQAIGNNLSNIGMAYLALKKFPQAEQAFIEAAQEMNRGDRKVRGNPGLVELYLATGKYDRAFDLLETMAPDWSTDDGMRLQLHTQRGAAFKGLGRLSEATVELLMAVAISENTRRTVSDRGGYFSSGYAGGRIRPYRLLLSVLCERILKGDTTDTRLTHLGKDMQDSAFRVAELIKARNLLESMAPARRDNNRSQLPGDLKRKELSLLNRLTALDEQWETAVKSGETAMAAYNANKGKLYAEFLGLLKVIKARHPQYAAMYYPDAVPASGLALGTEETLLEYAYGDGALYLFVVRKGGVKSVVRIPVALEELEKRIMTFMEPLYTNKPEAFSEPLSRELGETLMAAAQFGLKDGSRVIIVPDGMLGLLPFGALRPAKDNNDANPAYLDDRWIITYEHSASTLSLNRQPRTAKARRPLFAIGNPVFSEQDPRYTAYKQNKAPVQLAAGQAAGYPFRGLSVQAKPTVGGSVSPAWSEVVYSPLPETETEVRSIASTLKVKVVPPDVLLGINASKTGFLKSKLGQYRYLHFATHADLPGKVQGVGEPFILLGQVENKGNDNGFLTLSEILDLQLHADMVMLSACNTGKGDLIAGEGLANLARAFQHAGARSVVSSLWQVASEPAVEYMISFYGHMQKTGNRAVALSLARKEIKKKYPSPFYWSVFAFYGEGR